MSSAIKLMANGTVVPTVAGVSKQLKKSTKGKPQPQSTSQATLSNENDKEPGVWGMCGRAAHQVKNCAAKNTKCRKYEKKGHWQKMGRSKSTNKVEVAADNFLFTEELLIGFIEGWNAQIQINGKSAQFKLDTGADGMVEGTRAVAKGHKAQAQPDGSKGSRRVNAQVAQGFPGPDDISGVYS